MSNDYNDKKDDKFTSAMDDLKGLLDKEGIKLNADSSLDKGVKEDMIPTLNTVKIDISDIQDSAAEDSNILGTENLYLDNDSTPTGLPVLDGTITVIDDNESDSEDIDLDEYISDFEDDNFELTDFASSFEELEEKVESITAPEHIHKFEQDGTQSHQPIESHQLAESHQPIESHQPTDDNIAQQTISHGQLEMLKTELQNTLSLQIETAVNELKEKLTTAMHQEISQILDKLPPE